MSACGISRGRVSGARVACMWPPNSRSSLARFVIVEFLPSQLGKPVGIVVILSEPGRPVGGSHN